MEIHATAFELGQARSEGNRAYHACESNVLNQTIFDLIGNVPVGQNRTLEIMEAFSQGFQDAMKKELFDLDKFVEFLKQNSEN